jgi:hypothetical protein
MAWPGDLHANVKQGTIDRHAVSSTANPKGHMLALTQPLAVCLASGFSR